MSASCTRPGAARVLKELVDAASAPYRAAGRAAYYFARGKLTHDPVFAAILTRGLLGSRTRILDLGCGQGLLAAWLLAADRLAIQGTWPEAWPAPPRPARCRGIDLARRNITRARLALGAAADFALGDVRTADLGHADGIVLLDVLQYIAHADQQLLLERACAALPADGVLLLRVGNAAGGWRFTMAKRVDQMMMLASGRGLKPLHYRSTTEWLAMLAASSHDACALPMSLGTPFANDLIMAKQR